MQPRTAIALAAALGIVAAACQLVVGIEADRFAYVPPDAALDAGPTAEAGCGLLDPPARPDRDDDPATESDHVMAFRFFNPVGRVDGGSVLGYDLDGHCTCAPDDPGDGGLTCAPSPTAEPGTGCDYDGGLDNALVGVFDRLKNTPTASALGAGAARAADCGRASVLVMLMGYNGRANDARVEMSLFPSYGVREAPDGGEGLDGGCRAPADTLYLPPYAPRWDGHDRWSVPTNTVVRRPSQLPSPAAQRAGGWVRDGVMVMDARRLPSATMPLLFGSSIVSLGTPLMVGRLVPLDAAGADLPLDEAGNPVGKPANFRLTEGVVTGRARTNEVLSTVGAVALIGIDGGEDRYLCSPANAILYTFLKASLCAAADTMLDPLDEFAGRPCDSSSVAFQFEASPAQVGVDYDRLAPTDGCGAGWRDTCEPAK